MGREFCFSLACLSLVLTTNGQTMAGIILDFRADDPALAYGSVPAWQDLAVADGAQNATPLGTGPIKTTTIINGFLKDVVRFTGGSVGTPLVSLTQLPIAGGSIFLVMKSTDTGGSNRIIGWEDASHGANGVALLTKLRWIRI